MTLSKGSTWTRDRRVQFSSERIRPILFLDYVKSTPMQKLRSRTFIQFLSRRLIATGAMLSVAVLSASAVQGAGIAWHGNIQEAAQQAAAQHKPMLVMVKARWCGPCHKMLETTFLNPTVAAQGGYRLSVHPRAARRRRTGSRGKIALGIEAVMPTVLVISPERKVTGRFTGFQSAAQLDARLASLTPPPIRQFSTPQYRPQFRSWGNCLLSTWASEAMAWRSKGGWQGRLRRARIPSCGVTRSPPCRPDPMLSFRDRYDRTRWPTPRNLVHPTH